jgi:hypothetical protein
MHTLCVSVKPSADRDIHAAKVHPQQPNAVVSGSGTMKDQETR